ncbi:transcription factor E2F/dimerization partner [Mucor lusitanicus]
MTLSQLQLPPATKLPAIKLPSLIYSTRDEWAFNNNQQTISCYPAPQIAQTHMSTDILLPPILPTAPATNSYSPPPTSLPDSPPYSSCSSLSVSSLPSSPDTVPDTSFSSCHVPQHHTLASTKTTKKNGCSIESLLNSGSELLALEREDQLNRRSSTPSQKTSRAAALPYFSNKKQPALDDGRNTKGLRLFSKQVCDKVAERGVTTYNEVADELAAEIQQKSTVPVDQKNIRRRVYDALNVLMAMDIITKDRKQIKWLGLHHHQQPLASLEHHDAAAAAASFDMQQTMLEQEIQQEESRQQRLLESIQKSKHDLNTTFEDFARLEKLVKRNQQQQTEQQTQVVHLPFFMVSSNENIHTHWNHSKEAVLYSHSNCSVHHDMDILAKLWPSLSKTPNVVS